jgi:hypothetical protein
MENEFEKLAIVIADAGARSSTSSVNAVQLLSRLRAQTANHLAELD